MKQLTTDGLMEIIRDCAGEGDPVEATDRPEDLEFTALGYDSLALLETLSRLERVFGVAIEDDEFARAKTPAQLTTLVNRLLAESS
ncbi:acyl carrier protein [Streptomyces litmocidini]|uniref:Acyl carrier protein n=1 Tax=Streptomyces litmocidini TaxID=67318 RepID=A0ABW7U020_9ACTN|nr:acyl carrier protein [Streptomyces sp. PanSC19]ROQ36060.1 act minimal PKS acyl carrier protein [Streptomyces sp. PanSC19]